MKISIRLSFCIAVFILSAPARPASAQDPPYVVFFKSDRDGIKYMDYYISEIYKMNPDGSEQTRLTSNDYRESDLTPTEDGEKLAFVLSDNPDYKNADMDVVWMNYDGSELESLSDDIDNNDFDPAISRDRKWMVYSSVPRYQTQDNQKYPDLWRKDLETGEKKRLTNNSVIDYYPELSPDEKEIVFLQGRTRVSEYQFWLFDYEFSDAWFRRDVLRYIDLETGEDGDLGETQLDHYPPIYSPDGDYIATSSQIGEYDNRFTLYTWEGEKAAEYYFGGNSYCFGFDFTPDSRLAVFRCSSHGGSRKSQLFIMDIANEFKVTALTPPDYYVGSFDISPDGKTVFFSSVPAKGEYHNYLVEIYRIEIDGTGLAKLTDNRAYECCIAVSPFLNQSDDGEEESEEEE